MHSLRLLPHYLFFYEYMFINDMLHPYTLVRPIRQGFKYPTIRCEKSEHFHKCGIPNL